MRLNSINPKFNALSSVQPTFSKRIKITSSEPSKTDWGGVEGVLSNGKRFHCYATSDTQFSVTITDKTGQKLYRHYGGDTNQYPQSLLCFHAPQGQAVMMFEVGKTNPYIKEYKPPKTTTRLVNMLLRLLTDQKYPENTGQRKSLSDVLPPFRPPILYEKVIGSGDLMSNVNIKFTTTGDNNYQLTWSNRANRKGSILSVQVDPKTGKVSSFQNFKVRTAGEAFELLEQPGEKNRPFGKKKRFRVLKALIKRLKKASVDPSTN